MLSAKPTRSTFFSRVALPVVWGAGFMLIVGWAACGRTVTVSSAGTAGAGGTSSATGTSATGPGCTNMNCGGGEPLPGSVCTTPGVCCTYMQCDHAGGINDVNLICTNGNWKSY